MVLGPELFSAEERTQGDIRVARHLSVEKRARQNKVRNQRNRIVKSSIRGVYKDAEAVKGSDAEGIAKVTALAQRIFDRAASKHVVHKKKAARMKSRLMKRMASKES
jgi:small subunit ribosomal protein S20